MGLHQLSIETIKVVGFDPSLTAWGIAVGTFNIQGNTLSIESVKTVSPVTSKNKSTRVNSDDLERASQLAEAAVTAVRGAHAVFVEVPVGSQSARAMASYGICVGILGTMRSQGIPFFEVTATEVKMAATGKRTATKKEMISWATGKFPDVAWPRYKKHGELLLVESEVEHQADAIGAINAGLLCQPFKQLLQLWK